MINIPNNMQNQFLPMLAYVFPGSKWNGALKNYTPPSDEIYLFIDERKITSKNGNAFFLGGILTEKTLLEELNKFTINFKKKFRSDLNPNKWFLKGSGEWINESFESQKESKNEALSRWLLWSNEIEKLDTKYNFHATTTLIDKLEYTHTNKKKKKQEVEYLTRAFENLLTTLLPYKYSKINIVTDNIENTQKEVFEKVFNNAKRNYNLQKFEIIKKNDFASVYSNILQFVDMQIYALSRFIMPTDSGNILMNFEEYAMEHSNKTIFDTAKNKGNYYIHQIASKHHIIGKLYHHFRWKISQNYHLVELDDEALSSVILISKEKHLNFGSIVNSNIFHFLNNPHNAKYFDINKC